MSFGLKSPLLRMVLCLVLSVTLAVPAQTRAFLSPAVTAHEPEDAFGNLIYVATLNASTGSLVSQPPGSWLQTPGANHYLYCGEQFDPDLGLYFLRARFMNPDSGRFWSMDSYEGKTQDPESLHKYLYANADPVMYSDPSGRESLLGLMFASGVRQLLTKMASPHLRTAIVFVGAYTAGYLLGIKGPEKTISILAATGAPVALLSDIFVRGMMWNRGATSELFGISLTQAMVVARFFYTYVQPVTFVGAIGATGFATGYLSGLVYYYNKQG